MTALLAGADSAQGAAEADAAADAIASLTVKSGEEAPTATIEASASTTTEAPANEPEVSG